MTSDPGSLSRGSRRVRRVPSLLLPLLLLIVTPGCIYSGITPTAREVHSLYSTIFSLAAGVFAVVILWLLVSVVVFRRRRGDDSPAPQREGKTWVVVGFFLIGLVLVATLFPTGERTLASVDKVAKNPLVVIKMEGFQWEWTAYYQGEGLVVSGKTLKQPLVFDVPVDEPVKIELVSRDVMHEFFLPALLFMRNATPGRTNVFSFTPTKIGTYPGQCAQFCGLWHSRMTFVMRVVNPSDYAAWVKAEKAAVLKATCPVVTGPISITAKNISWNTNCLAVPTGPPVDLTVVNDDAGIDHNFAIYTSPDQKHQLFATGRFSGVASKTDALPSLPPGKYYFQCNVHGPAMSGVFIVEKPAG
jgi:cytochrome c oxidase subunit II